MSSTANDQRFGAPQIDSHLSKTRKRLIAMCGVLILACGALAIALPVHEPAALVSLAAALLIAAGSSELAVGFLRGSSPAARMDMTLGTLSIVGAVVLLFSSPVRAFEISGLVATWLLARGALDLLISFFASGEGFSLGLERVLRASVDLVLGTLTLLAVQLVLWWELILGWPVATISAVILMMSLSLLASGFYYIGLGTFPGRRSVGEGDEIDPAPHP